MAYEVINNLRSPSIIRAEGAGTYTITLANLSANTSLETVSSASIRRLAWSSNGYVTVARGATPNVMLSLYQTGVIKLDELGYSMANGSTGNIVVTITTGGSIVMEVTKTATYSSDLNRL
jgi:hypothetical protein